MPTQALIELTNPGVDVTKRFSYNFQKGSSEQRVFPNT